ncbi:TonB-dependent receptor [Cnuella takakiae]|nr:carboxypeptidase regulatory-like domain-containing protein [Cnuella takakiae]
MRKLTLFMVMLMTMISTFAQETTAEIQGIITDAKGAILQGATVTAVHVPTGTSYSTSSRKDGRFNLPNLRVGGPYEVKVTFVGFGEEKHKDLFLNIGQVLKNDFALASASAQLTEVVVTGTRSDKVFNKGRTGAAEVINRQQIDRLPTVNRSIQDFTRLTPSANGSSFAGRSSSYNNLTVNGASFNNTFGLSGTLGGQSNSQPISIDALDQIQVNIAPYDVTLGAFTGAGINSVTKSGTNEFKGTVYNYWKNPEMTGRKVGDVTLAKQQFEYGNRGVSFGGPIIKNKLFFFVSGEQERVSQPATSFVASRNGSSGVGISQAKAEDLDALAAFLKEKFNYSAGPYEGYNYKTYSDKVTARFDLNINKKNTLNVNYYYLKSWRNVGPSSSGHYVSTSSGRSAGTTAMPFFSSSYIINNNFNIVVAELNTRISNKASNKLQVGYNRLRDFRSSPGGTFPMVDILNGQGGAFTSFGYEPFTANNLLNTDTWQLNDIFTLYKGAHTITLGTQNTFNKFRNGFAPNYNGIYTFNSLADFYASARNNTPTALRYQLQYSARKGGEFPFADINALQLGFFAQDKWNLRQNLTLTAGLRADVPIFGDVFTANAAADALTYRNGAKINTGSGPKTSILWSPRVGYNWDVFGDKKTQVRGGVGIFAGAPPFVWISNQASNNGLDFGSVTYDAGKNGVAATNPIFAFNANVNANRPSNGAANTNYGLAVTDPNFKFPQVARGNFAVDQKLPFDITATVEGLYTKDLNAVYHQNLNLPATGTALVGADNRIRYAATKIYSGAGGATLANPNLDNVILMTNTKKGYSYNMTLQLQRNVNNLYTMVAYTYAKSKSVNDGGSVASSIWRDRSVSGDPNAEALSFSNFYQPHRVVAAAFYRKEYAHFFATSLGFTFEAANGGTASYTYSGDLNGDGLTSNDLVYVPRNQSEIVLEAANAADVRTADQLWNQLNAYIIQDKYLSSRRGQYVERNGVLLPFYKRLDLNFTQDFFVKVKNKRNTIRFTADVFNFGNLLNKDWGIFQTTNRTQLLTLKRVEATGVNAGKPVFSFPYFDATNKLPLKETFQNSTGQGSRYQVQLGVRYIFN